MAGGTTTATEHRFQALSLGGLTINHPPLFVTEADAAQHSGILLGLHELSLFPLYISYHARKMYLSPR